MSSELLPSIPGTTAYRSKLSKASIAELYACSTTIPPSSAWRRKTVPPGRIPARSRIALGMTIWPLGPTFADPIRSSGTQARRGGGVSD